MRGPEWGEEFQRLVLACFLQGTYPTAPQPQLFGSAARGAAPTPRQRLAAALAEYWGKYGSAPSPEVFREVARRVGEGLGEAERAVVSAEADRILSQPALEDPTFVVDQIKEWSEYISAAQGVLQAADLLDAGPTSLAAVRELLAKATEPAAPGDGRARSVAYQEGAEERLAAWRRGEEYGERIPTGFAELDSVLKGGPTRREVFYFLAPPKGAKTSALLRLALHAARRRFGVYVATYEMQAMRVALRVDRMLSRQSKEELREDLTRLEKALEGLKLSGAGEIVIDERPPQQPNCVQQAALRIDQLRREGRRIDLVVLDYLNIMGSSRDEREKRHELSRISREVSALAKSCDVLVWSAALVKRAAVNKRVIRKDDIAEAYEVIAVMDGGVAICGTKEMIANGFRRFYVVAAREEQDEVRAGDYRVDFARMTLDPAEDGAVDAVDPEADRGKGGEEKT